MVLDVSDVADMEFLARKIATFKTAASDERLLGFFCDDAGELFSTVLQIVPDRRSILKLLLLDKFKLLVVTKEVSILAMKRLVSE